MDSIVSIIPEIKSWFPLIALIFACLAFIVRRAVKKESALIELAEDEKRAELVEQHFRGRSVNLENLTAEQQYQYAMSDLKGRQKAFTYMFALAMAAIFLSTLVVYMQKDPEEAGGEGEIAQGETKSSRDDKNSKDNRKNMTQKNSQTRPPRPEDFINGGRPPRPEDFVNGGRPPRPEDFADGERPPRPEDSDNRRPPRPGDKKND